MKKGEKGPKTDAMISYYLGGYTPNQIAKTLNCSADSVRAILTKYNIPRRPRNQRGAYNPKWRGGVIFDGTRKAIYRPDHPRPDFNKVYVHEYKLIMEEKLGRYLAPDEVVHHIDGDETNNHPENLLVMTKSQHAKLHAYQNQWKQTHQKFLDVHKSIKRNKNGTFVKYGELPQ